MKDQLVDFSLVAHILGMRKVHLGYRTAAFASSVQNPLYRPRSTYSSYYLPRSAVYGSTATCNFPTNYQSHKGPCDGTAGPYSPERIAAARQAAGYIQQPGEKLSSP